LPEGEARKFSFLFDGSLINSYLMEEAERLTESSEEHINHAAHSGAPWITWVALSTAILGGLAAIGSNLSGSNETEAMLHQIESSDTWAQYQAKGIKLAITEAREEISGVREAISQTTTKLPDEKAKEFHETAAQKAAHYQADQKKIKDTAHELQIEATIELRRHETFARAVTLFQVAIVVGAVSALTGCRRYWLFSLAFGAGGAALLAWGLVGHFVG
jgi:hypothetical protein